MTLRIAAGVVVLAGITTVVSWLMPTDVGPSIAFADVQEKLAKVKSVSYSPINRTTGNPETTTYVRILEGNLSRVELPNNEVQIFDFNKRRMLRMFTQKKKADLTIGFDRNHVRDVLDQFLGISKMKSVGDLPDKKIAGKTAKEFVVEDRGHKVKVWIDPDTKLPLRMEMVNSRTQLITGMKQEIEVYEILTDFVYDKKFDEDLFDTTPPSDYVVTMIRIPKLTPKQLEKDAELVITPNVGFGPAKFGMSMQDVIQLLREPEEINTREAPDGIIRTAADLKNTVTFQSLRYRSRGFTITIHPTEGFRNVVFQAHLKNAPIGRTFKGKTKEGIGIGAGREKIMKAYGSPNYDRSNKTPDEKTTYTQLTYWDLGLNFTLKDGNVDRMSVSTPRKKKD
jgi:outer membrane lipoprotein-sorting protein